MTLKVRQFKIGILIAHQKPEKSMWWYVGLGVCIFFEDHSVNAGTNPSMCI